MQISDILLQSAEFQELYVKEYKKRQSILQAMQDWNMRSKELSEELQHIRSSCSHPLENVKKCWDEDEYGKLLDSGYIDYICPDCGARRSETF